MRKIKDALKAIMILFAFIVSIAGPVAIVYYEINCENSEFRQLINFYF